MNRRCPHCDLVNPRNTRGCPSCGRLLDESENISSKRGFSKPTIAKRVSVCIAVLVAVMVGFYVSLVYSADALAAEETRQINTAIELLEQKGFADEALLLKHVAIFRSTDNWLNASVVKENAYAATNFPFEIVTIYPDFFKYATDDIERAAILLHEAKHLQGKNEKEAYDFVWRNRTRLGWIGAAYARSAVLLETRKVTREYSPNLFVCDFNQYHDCTENSLAR